MAQTYKLQTWDTTNIKMWSNYPHGLRECRHFDGDTTKKSIVKNILCVFLVRLIVFLVETST